jgi:ADP-ribosylation factor-like protein 5B
VLGQLDMGLLVSSLWRRLFAMKEFKACIVGLDNSGKTTILFQLHMGEVVETQPTIGSNVETVQHGGVNFNVWDLGGQESLRASWSTYYLGCHAVIVVVDSTDRARIDLVKMELDKLLANTVSSRPILGRRIGRLRPFSTLNSRTELWPFAPVRNCGTPCC